MNAGYTIRRATPRDAASLPRIERAAARLFLEYAEVLGLTSEMLERTNSIQDFARAEQAGLLWVAVTREDTAVGFALLRRVCESAQAAGRDRVTLSTFRDVPWNAPFYARHGFRVLSLAEMTPGLIRLRENEQGRGLRTDLRVVMRFDCRD